MKRCYVGLKQSLDPLRALIRDVEASAGLKCPNCDDVGFTVEQNTSHFNEEDFVQVQCEFCYTVPDSIFNRRMEENPLPLADGS